jgi:hypothetical protein
MLSNRKILRLRDRGRAYRNSFKRNVGISEDQVNIKTLPRREIGVPLWMRIRRLRARRKDRGFLIYIRPIACFWWSRSLLRGPDAKDLTNSSRKAENFPNSAHWRAGKRHASRCATSSGAEYIFCYPSRGDGTLPADITRGPGCNFVPSISSVVSFASSSKLFTSIYRVSLLNL